MIGSPRTRDAALTIAALPDSSKAAFFREKIPGGSPICYGEEGVTALAMNLFDVSRSSGSEDQTIGK
jgi:hypothetical protein